ncbi:hypothetical protein [Actinoplanes sp. ATCC 53533]|uniref:hypothetical protein n=1 Tax=Actinoplanes sp. ATCC 53533 TaxID=1288362 RepID=UPI001F24E7D7|nr:hypothetical protein [Actinoplanes sp. ATCC 53533]
MVSEIAARAARRAMRRSSVIAALANAAIVVVTGIVATWLPSGWPTWPFFFVGIYLTMRTAGRVEKPGLVQARPAWRVVLVTAGVALALVLALALFVNPASAGGLWTYVIAAAVVLAVGLVNAWWVGR